MANNFKLPDGELLTLREVLELLNIGKSTWYYGIAKHIYPKPIKISARTRLWALVDIEASLARLNTSRHQQG